MIEGSDLDLSRISAAALADAFPSTDLVHIGDEIVDGVWERRGQDARPLALFDGLSYEQLDGKAPPAAPAPQPPK